MSGPVLPANGMDQLALPEPGATEFLRGHEVERGDVLVGPYDGPGDPELTVARLSGYECGCRWTHTWESARIATDGGSPERNKVLFCADRYEVRR